MPGSHEHHWNRGRFFEGNIIGNDANVSAPGERSCGEAKNCQTENTITWPNVLNPGSHGSNYACDFVSEDPSIRCFPGIKRKRLEHVAEIHSGGFDIDHHFARTALRRREGNKL